MPAPANRLENLRTLRVANLDGAFSNAFATLVGGAFFIQLVQYLAGKQSDQWIGIFTAVPPLLGLLQIPGAIWGRSYPFYRKFVSPGGWIWRLLYIPFIFIPFLPMGNDQKLWLLLLCVSLATAAIQIVVPIYNDWLAEMVPANSRGWYFSRRNMLAAAVGATVAMGGGLLFDYFKRSGRIDLAFSITFGMGVVFAIVSMIFFMQMSELERPNPLKISLASGTRAMLAPFRDSSFRKVLIFFVVFLLSQTIAGNFFTAYAFEVLHMETTQLQVTAVTHAIGSLFAIRFWGFLSDRYGNKPILAILSLGIALTPLQWLLTRPNEPIHNTVVLGLGHILGGVCWSGVGMCQFNLLLATAKEDDRANYIGAGQALSSLVSAISPLIGAQIMVLGRPLFGDAQAYIWLFVLTTVLRFISIAFLVPVQEEGAFSIRGTFKQLLKSKPEGYRALRQMTQSETESGRGEAIATAASSQFEIARTDVIKALHDPSPLVRRQAAMALSRLGGPDAVGALTHMLRDHPDLIDEESLEALGDLGDRSAVHQLLPYLHSPRPSIRRSAAKALGQIGGEEAAVALRQAASHEHDPDLRRAALQGLRLLGAVEAEPEICASLSHPLPSVRIAAAEAVSAMNLTGAAGCLRDALTRFEDEAGSEIAYALGAVGDASDMEAILKEAQRSESMITRRRCLLGLARMLGVEANVYKLFVVEDMTRDSLVLGELQPIMRRSPALEEAMGVYSSDDEIGALQVLAKAKPEPAYQLMAEYRVQESFLVAVYAFAQDLRAPSGWAGSLWRT